MAKIRKKRAWFDTKPIQKGSRVRLGHNLLRNLGIAEGDQVDLFYDAEEEAIVVKRSQLDTKRSGNGEKAGSGVATGGGG